MLKAATPPTACTMVVPSSLPPLGPEAIANVTSVVLALPVETIFPYWSSTLAVAGIVAPADVLVGDWLKTTFTAEAGVTVTAVVVVPWIDGFVVSEAVMFQEPAVSRVATA